MRRAHEMPFGAAWSEGTGRFRLWAPASREVTLVLGEGERAREIAMRAEGEGWHEARVDGVAPGTAYAFRVDAGASVADPASRRQLHDVNGPSVVVPSWSARAPNPMYAR